MQTLSLKLSLRYHWIHLHHQCPDELHYDLQGFVTHVMPEHPLCLCHVLFVLHYVPGL